MTALLKQQCLFIWCTTSDLSHCSEPKFLVLLQEWSQLWSGVKVSSGMAHAHQMSILRHIKSQLPPLPSPFLGPFPIGCSQRGLNIKSPRSSSLWVPRNLSHHMIMQARTRDTVLVEYSREMTGRPQTVPWWLGGGGGVKTTEKNTWPVSVLFLNYWGTIRGHSSSLGWKAGLGNRLWDKVRVPWSMFLLEFSLCTVCSACTSSNRQKE